MVVWVYTLMLGTVFNCSHFYWSKAFPLYGHNYDSVLEAIDKMEKNLPGFFYAGNCLKNINFISHELSSFPLRWDRHIIP